VRQVSGGEDTSELEREIDGLNTALQQEKAAHDATRDELESVEKQLQAAKDELALLQNQSQSQVQTATAVLEANMASKDEVNGLCCVCVCMVVFIGVSV
jgi:septal ring factor EnvC (AmiA/AmiB activator)